MFLLIWPTVQKLSVYTPVNGDSLYDTGTLCNIRNWDPIYDTQLKYLDMPSLTLTLLLQSYIYIYIYIFHMFSFIQNNYKRRRNVFVNFVWSRACRWISTDYAQKYKHYNTYTHSYIIHLDSRMFQSSPDEPKGCIISCISKKQMIYKIHKNYGYSKQEMF